ncbi:hypothetical protein QJQ45_026664 [Haematococcus lacustris]|nr:hypothetical protein QJQ45_026664 [Haematococcus lacustris]
MKTLYFRTQLIVQVTQLQKGPSESVSEYMQRAQHLACEIAKTGPELIEQDFACFVLLGLPADYDALVVSLMNKPQRISDILHKMQCQEDLIATRQMAKDDSSRVLIRTEDLERQAAQKRCADSYDLGHPAGPRCRRLLSPPPADPHCRDEPAREGCWVLAPPNTYHHLTCDEDLLADYRPFTRYFMLNGREVKAVGIGRATITTPYASLWLHNVLHVPSMTCNLMSLDDTPTATRLHARGLWVKLTTSKGRILAVSRPELHPVKCFGTGPPPELYGEEFEEAVQMKTLYFRTQLIAQVTQLQKGPSESISKYMRRAQHLACEIAKTGPELPEQDIACFVLLGLPTDYDALVVSLMNKPQRISDILRKMQCLEELIATRQMAKDESSRVLIRTGDLERQAAQKRCADSYDLGHPAGPRCRRPSSPPPANPHCRDEPAREGCWVLAPPNTHHHLACDEDLLADYRPFTRYFMLNGREVKAVGIGRATITTPWASLRLHNVLHVPSMTCNLISLDDMPMPTRMHSRGINVTLTTCKGRILAASRYELHPVKCFGAGPPPELCGEEFEVTGGLSDISCRVTWRWNRDMPQRFMHI